MVLRAGQSAGAAKLDALIDKIRRQTLHDKIAAAALDTIPENPALYTNNASAHRPPLPPLPPQLATLHLTSTAYHEGDTLGLVAAATSLTPVLVVAGLTGWVWARRDLRAIFLVVTSVALCAMLEHARFSPAAIKLMLSAMLVAHASLFLWSSVTMEHGAVWKPLYAF